MHYVRICLVASPGTSSWPLAMLEARIVPGLSYSPMADSILTSINMAGGAINIYYDTILMQNSLSGGNFGTNISLLSSWKVVLITSAQYTRASAETLLFPFPLFTNVSSDFVMPAINSSGVITVYTFAYIQSNQLWATANVDLTYIVAG